MMERQYHQPIQHIYEPASPSAGTTSIRSHDSASADLLRRQASLGSSSAATAPEHVPFPIIPSGLESVPETFSSLEVAHPLSTSASPSHAYGYPAAGPPTGQWPEGASGKEWNPQQAAAHQYFQEVAELHATPRRPWWKWKRTWAIVVVAVLAIIGIALGCAFGLRRSDGGEGSVGGGEGAAQTSGAPTSTATTPLPAVPTGTSACSSSVICGQVLASITDTSSSGASAKSPLVHLFARGTDGTLKQATSQAGGASFTASASSSSWQSLGGSISASGGVQAIAWTKGGLQTFSVFGRSAATSSDIIFKDIVPATGVQPAFGSLTGGNVVSAPVLCDVGSDRIDVWVRSETSPGEFHVNHRFIDRPTAAFVSFWDTAWATDKQTTSRPGVVCRDSESYHDVVVYGNETTTDGGYGAWHRQWRSDALGWGKWIDMGGSYAAGSEPVLVEVGANRFDFFGLGTDGRLYYWSYTTTTAEGYSAQLVLDGELFASVPAVLVSGTDNSRLDVVAVGRDGKLKHRALIGTDWGAGWEDLGVQASSTPLLARVNASAAGAFMIAVDGTAWYAHVTITQDRNWSTLPWMPLAGL